MITEIYVWGAIAEVWLPKAAGGRCTLRRYTEGHVCAGHQVRQIHWDGGPNKGRGGVPL